MTKDANIAELLNKNLFLVSRGNHEGLSEMLDFKPSPCLPLFVTQELQKFLACGIPSHGYWLMHCECLPQAPPGGLQLQKPGVLPEGVPIRQWVLTLPYPLRYPLASSDLRLIPRFHTLFLKGVYLPGPENHAPVFEAATGEGEVHAALGEGFGGSDSPLATLLSAAVSGSGPAPTLASGDGGRRAGVERGWAGVGITMKRMLRFTYSPNDRNSESGYGKARPNIGRVSAKGFID